VLLIRKRLNKNERKMKTKVLHITSGKGPAECCRAVALALKELVKEAEQKNLKYEIVERSIGQEHGTLNSATIQLVGKEVEIFVQSWEGSLLWICQSPYRIYHKRKNWFIGIKAYDSNAVQEWKEQDIKYQTMRASGPGGQNVNKIESAVRAIHIPTGAQVTASDTRSQLQNKKLARERLKVALEKVYLEQMKTVEVEQWLNHHQLERGNAKRVYEGFRFEKK
jgi:peptide chain release factor